MTYRMLEAPTKTNLTESKEETLVLDERGTLTPSQLVDRKLASLVRRCPMMVSELHDYVSRRTFAQGKHECRPPLHS